jgi:hypothetical protein
MIQIIFVPGTFGSAIEQFIRCFTENPTVENFVTADDGSTHVYTLPYHFTCRKDLQNFYDNYPQFDSNEIISSIYPMHDFSTSNVICFFNQEKFTNDKKILIQINSMRDAELVLLFQYYKQAHGSVQKQTNSLFFNELKNHLDVLGNNYKTINDVPIWAVREWFSLYYPGQVSTWINFNNNLSNTFIIDYKNILHQPVKTIKNIIDFTNKKIYKQQEMIFVAEQWRIKQQYILSVYDRIDNIVEFTTNNIYTTWNELNIIAEAIIQSRLRNLGFELKCFGLDEFPTDSLSLYNLLEKKS